MVNGIWSHIENLNTTFWNRLTNGKIERVFVDAGEWNTNHSIYSFLSQSQIDTFVNGCHQRGMEAVAWIHYRYDRTKINISQASYHELMGKGAQDLLNKGYDAIEDDLEPYMWSGQLVNVIGSIQNYAEFANVLARAAHNVGKLCGISMNIGSNQPELESMLRLITEVDYGKAMLYNGGTYNLDEMRWAIPRVLSNANFPVMLGLRVPFNVGVLNWIDTVSPPLGNAPGQVLGFGCFEYRDFSNNDWDRWYNWESKDLTATVSVPPLPNGEPPQVECNVPNDCQVKFGAPKDGYEWNCRNNKCVQTQIYVPPEQPPTPPVKTIAARVPCLGNNALVQYYMRRLRNKVITEETHKKLHPLV